MKFPHVLEARGWVFLLNIGLLLVLPLIFYRGFTEQFSYTKIFLTKILIVLGLTAWAVGLVWGKLRGPADFRLGPPLALLSFAILVSCVNSPVPAFSLREAEYFLCGPVWLLLLASWTRGEAAMRSAAALVTVASTVVAAIALAQWLGHDPLLFGDYRIEWGTMVPRMRLYSTFGNPNFVAGYLIGTVFLALALAADSLRLWARAAWGTSAALVLAAIVGAGSRGAWAGLVAGLLIAGFVWTRGANPTAVPDLRTEHNCRASGVRVSLFPAVSGFLALHLVNLLDVLLRRLEGRLYLWRVSWPMFSEHPLLGSGWGTFQLRFLDLQAGFLGEHPALVRHWSNIQHLHNDFLQLWLEAGAVGLAAFGWVLWTYGREVREALKSTAPRSIRLWLCGSVGGVTAILVDSIFNYQFAVPPTFLLLFTLLAFPSLLKGGTATERGASASRSAAEEHSRRSEDSRTLQLSKPAQRPGNFRALRVLASSAIFLCAGALVIRTGRHATAEQQYASALRFEGRGELVRAEETYRRGLALNPLNGRLHFGLARILYFQDKFPEALREVLQAKRTYRDSHLEVLKARIEDQMGLSAAALESYRRALALDPTLRTVQADIERLRR